MTLGKLFTHAVSLTASSHRDGVNLENLKMTSADMEKKAQDLLVWQGIVNSLRFRGIKGKAEEEEEQKKKKQ